MCAVTAAGAALVTGGARRIGRELTLALAGRGLDVAVHFNTSRDDALRTVGEARAMGVRAEAISADFDVEEETMSLVERAAKVLGRPLSVLINNAARFDRDRIETATPTGWNSHFRPNLEVPFFLIQKFAEQAPGVERDHGGEPVAAASVINMVDQRVLRPTSEFATYTVSKAALWALTQSCAVALAPAVRVNAIGPGPALPASRQSQDHFNRQRRATPLGRGADVADIVAAMNFILDAKSLTGQLLCLDGGQFLKWNHAPGADNSTE